MSAEAKPTEAGAAPGADEAGAPHGGQLVARRLRANGVSKLFTLSGGHLFSIYDGCRDEGIDIVDVRHEQSAAFAAEGWAKATREPGVCALTAGPGVTNGMSAMASALQNASPMLVLGGRAPAFRWGQGSLQEIDHVPFTAPVTKLSRTVESTADIPGAVDEALRVAAEPPTGPAFLDFPLDQVFMQLDAGGTSDGAGALPDPADAAAAPSGDGLERAAELLRGASRPVIMAGTGLYWAHGEDALRRLCEELSVPVFLNGLARGCVPADHPQFFSRARGKALQEADVALVVGVPMDFRLGFGASLGDETEIVVIGLGAARPTPSAAGRGRALRRRARDPRRAPRGRRRAGPIARSGTPSCARSRTRSAPASRRSWPMIVLLSIRYGSTESFGRCSTATRSSSATAAISSPTRGG